MVNIKNISIKEALKIKKIFEKFTTKEIIEILNIYISNNYYDLNNLKKYIIDSKYTKKTVVDFIKIGVLDYTDFKKIKNLKIKKETIKKWKEKKLSIKIMIKWLTHNRKEANNPKIPEILKENLNNSKIKISLKKYKENGSETLEDVKEWLSHYTVPKDTKYINLAFENTKDFFNFLKEKNIEHHQDTILKVSKYIYYKNLMKYPEEELYYWFFFPKSLYVKDFPLYFVATLSKKMKITSVEMKYLISKELNFKNGYFTKQSVKEIYNWYKRKKFNHKDIKILIELLKENIVDGETPLPNISILMGFRKNRE